MMPTVFVACFVNIT